MILSLLIVSIATATPEPLDIVSLGSPRFEIREAARTQLTNRVTSLAVPIDVVESAARNDKLSQEVRGQLRRVISRFYAPCRFDSETPSIWSLPTYLRYEFDSDVAEGYYEEAEDVYVKDNLIDTESYNDYYVARLAAYYYLRSYCRRYGPVETNRLKSQMRSLEENDLGDIALAEEIFGLFVGNHSRPPEPIEMRIWNAKQKISGK